MTSEENIKRIKKALAIDGTHSWDDLVELLRHGKMQMFWSEHGAWIVEVLDAPQCRYLNVWIVAGELPEVMDLQPEVEKYARQMGCIRIIAHARLGWKHVAKEHGWTTNAMVISRPIGEANA